MPSPARRGGGFTLVEMLTTVALLIIVLGLMVSLARYVRRRSAEELTRKILINLHLAMDDYRREHGKPNLVGPVDPQANLDEATLAAAAEAENRRIVQFFNADKALSAKAFKDFPLSIYDQATIRDAWGMPIVYMPSMHRQIGQSPGEWFFFSAGPDRQYLTRVDNQYSYEAMESPAGH
jgi:type II secretory pathway pseudopilin PulG